MMKQFLFPSILHHPKAHFLLVISIAAFMSFFRLGSESVNEWDEARNGVNAMEMIGNGDYLNLFFAGEPDTWNNKPPLVIWMIALSFKIFGYNEWALRLSSALAAIVFFIFFFKLISRFESEKFAMLVCLLLVSCKAVYGSHVARTGDFDMPLLCFLIISTYYFIIYLDTGAATKLYLSAVFLGIAFYVKGPAALILVPGNLLYLIHQRKLRTFFFKKEFFVSGLIFLLIASSWVILVSAFGKSYNTETSFYQSRNALETMFFHDTVQRMFDPSFDKVKLHDHFFFFKTLDSKLNLWNYLFYVTLLSWMLQLLNVAPARKGWWRLSQHKLFSFSVIHSLTLGIIMTLITSKRVWYLVPALPFAATVAAYGYRYLYLRHRIIKMVLIAVTAFALIRQVVQLSAPDNDLKKFFQQMHPQISSYKKVKIIDQPDQSFLLYLHWNSRKLINHFGQTPDDANALYCIRRNNIRKNEMRIAGCTNDFCLGEFPVHHKK